MKAKNWAPDKVKEQIENGWIKAQKIIQETKQSISIEHLSLIPMLLKKRSNPIDVRQLKKYKIGKQSIIIRNCGLSLSQVL